MIPTIAKGRKWQVFVEVKVLLDFDILRFFLSFLAMKGNPFILLAPMRKHLFLGILSTIQKSYKTRIGDGISKYFHIWSNPDSTTGEHLPVFELNETRGGGVLVLQKNTVCTGRYSIDNLEFYTCHLPQLVFTTLHLLAINAIRVHHSSTYFSFVSVTFSFTRRAILFTLKFVEGNFTRIR